MKDEEPEPNWQVYHHIIGLFQLWPEDGNRKNKYHGELCRIAGILELPTNSEEHKIITCVKAPTDEQTKLVALTLARRAIKLHWELG